MDEQPMYAVCTQRNNPAAFERFLALDSGGVDRFFDNAVERELFFGRRLHYGMAAFAERADAFAAVCAAFRPLVIALWMNGRRLAGARMNGRRLVPASGIRRIAAASLSGAGIPTLPGIPLLLPVRRRPLADSYSI